MIRETTTAALATLALAFAAAPAQGAAPHVHSFAISGPAASPLSRPEGIAVDNSGGPSADAVYVVDSNQHRVVKFDPSGAFVLMFGDGVNGSTGADVCTAASGDRCGPGTRAAAAGAEPGAFSEPDYIAVDGSAGPSAGDVYVADDHAVLKFDGSGAPISSWANGGVLDVGGVWTPGLAVDSQGNLVVVTTNVRGEGPNERLYSRIREYDQAGVEEGSVEIGESIGFGLGIDSGGNRYLVGSDANVTKFSPTGAVLTHYPADGQAWGLAVDPSDNHLYVREGVGRISSYPTNCGVSPCAASERFGDGYLIGNGSWSLAVDRSTHSVYAVNSQYWGEGEVAVFRTPGVVPEVATGAVTRPSRRTAILEADVAPGSGGPTTSCGFEYIDRSRLENAGWSAAAFAVCAEGPTFSGHVTATISGFDAGRTYLYRAVASNGAGRRTGIAQRLDSGTLIEAATGAVDGLGPGAANLTGLVDPDPHLASFACYFFYYPEGHPEESGRFPRAVACQPASPYSKPTRVSAGISGLHPGTTYRYSILASDMWGEVRGAERTFVTPSVPRPPVPPEVKPPVIRPPRGGGKNSVRCSKEACTRSLSGSARLRTWVSPRFPRSYGWRFSVFKDGHSLPDSGLDRGCAGTFEGRGVIARLDACHGRFRLVYRGSGELTIRWRVFEFCRCAENAGGRGRRLRPAGVSWPAPRRAVRRFR